MIHETQAKNQATDCTTETVVIQVVLEHQWSSQRDQELITNIKASRISPSECVKDDTVADPAQQPRSPQSGASFQLSLKSVLESLSSKGIEVDDDKLLSFKEPAQNRYVLIGKSSDREGLESYLLPRSALTESEGSAQP